MRLLRFFCGQDPYSTKANELLRDYAEQQATVCYQVCARDVEAGFFFLNFSSSPFILFAFSLTPYRFAPSFSFCLSALRQFRTDPGYQDYWSKVRGGVPCDSPCDAPCDASCGVS